MTEIAIIGAGLAGLTCARRLHKAGYQVTVLEKSRGVGGRLATRRWGQIAIDHGACALQYQGDYTRALITNLEKTGVLAPWTVQTYRLEDQKHLVPAVDAPTSYIAPLGMTQIAKRLAADLRIYRQQRVTALNPGARGWIVERETSGGEPLEPLTVAAVVVAIPAPQALALLGDGGNGLLEPLKQRLEQIAFHGCITVMAGYAPTYQQVCQQWGSAGWQIQCPDHSSLAWLGLDSSKRSTAIGPLVVVQSNPALAQQYLDATDLRPATEILLQAATTIFPWMADPEWQQTHRWRYALVATSLPDTYSGLPTPFPLVCCGDSWGGATIEAALASGIDASEWLNSKLKSQDLIPGADVFQL